MAKKRTPADTPERDALDARDSQSLHDEQGSRDARSKRSGQGARDARSKRSSRSSRDTHSERSVRSTRDRHSEQSDRDAQSERNTRGKRGAMAEVPAPRVPIGKIILVSVAAIIVIVCVWLFSTTVSVGVTVNGEPLEIRGAKNLQSAIKESGLPINPGDLISLQGNVLEKGAGEQFTATINGELVYDLNTALHNGDDIQLSDGKDILEGYDEQIEIQPHSAEVQGIGAFRSFENIGLDGAVSVRTGELSGEVVSKQLFYPEDLVYSKHNPDVGEKKVVALTFDDGPNAAYTPEILDVLKENDAQATFFVLGNSIQELGNEWILQRAAEEGHLICTHTYDNAILSGGDIDNLDSAGQIAEIEDGRAAITEALGVEANRIMRIPGADMDADTLINLRPYIGVEVGWNVDTGDDKGAEVQSIVHELLDITPGDVVLLHDGGGDRSATVEALRIALPQLKEEGWKFVTLENLLKYPALK